MRLTLILLLNVVLASVIDATESMTRDEKLHEIDEIALWNEAAKGILEGMKQGWYNRYSVQLPPECLGHEAIVYEYKMWKIYTDRDFEHLWEVPANLYGFWIMLND